MEGILSFVYFLNEKLKETERDIFFGEDDSNYS